jgi:DNA-binding response OmpR family regulator
MLACFKEGANDFIKKPFRQADLLMRILMHMNTAERCIAELHVRVPNAAFVGAVPRQLLVSLYRYTPRTSITPQHKRSDVIQEMFLICVLTVSSSESTCSIARVLMPQVSEPNMLVSHVACGC